LYPQGYRPTTTQRREGTGGGAFGGFAFKTKEVEEISRSLTVQCSFTLIDATTGRAIASYSPPPLRKTDSASPDFLFGGMMDQAELDPVDEFIGELVERATREFVSTLVPVQFEHKADLSLSGKHGEAAIRAIRADDYATAMRELETSAAAGKDDDGSVSYAMGVVCELMGDYARALQMYRQAASAKDVDKDDLPKYMAAKDRMGNHLKRVMIPSANDPNAGAGPAEPPAAPPSAPPQPQRAEQPA
jgi:tetratricopeptide (TPR) repeat protein